MARTATSIAVSASLIVTGCGGPDVDPAQRATEIVSTRTVALAYLEENRLPEAEAEFEKLIELAPDDAAGYANLGLVYLRMNRYQEAEDRLDKALSLQPNDPGIHLLLSELYKVTDRLGEAIRILEAALQNSPGNTKILYSLSQIHEQRAEGADSVRSQQYLRSLVSADSANLAARLQLTEAMVRNGMADSALAQFAEIRRQVPDLPREAVDFFDQAERLLRGGRVDEAVPPTVIAHNFMKVTPLYQQGLIDLQGPPGASVGFPIFTFSRNITPTATPAEVLAAIRFTDATAAAGLDIATIATGTGDTIASYLAVADYDYDGDQDLYVTGLRADRSGPVSYLFRNDLGQFSDVATEAGLAPTIVAGSARFDDFDNDSLIDIFVAGDGENVLYRNQGSGTFTAITGDANLAASDHSHASVFVDLDHDGDLDLYVGNSGPNRHYRNNGDGSFTEIGESSGIAGESESTRDLAFADFDEDGDTDLFVVNTDANNVLYTNLRQGRFADITEQSGLATGEGSQAVAIGDYDNDGFMDLFITGHTSEAHWLLHNLGDGTFGADTRSPDLAALRSIRGRDAVFLDFDNDGYLDLFVVGQPVDASSRGVLLFHNDGSGRLEDMSHLLPQTVTSGDRVAIADYNEDGDIDLFVAGVDGGIRLLRNDGGDANQSFKVQLRGLTAGSGKNNYYGIGAKLEVRAGDLYQTRVVTSPMNHFGLGNRLTVDVVRTVWTNGVPQNSFFADTDQDLIEEQILKGSCGFLYAWNGTRYEFVTDMVWRSALGMPLGIMGGRAAYAPPHPSREFLRIPGDALQQKDGAYSIQITEELWETLYLDELQLIVVDHPESIDVYVDESFRPTSPTIPDLELVQARRQRAPVAVYDDQGRDWLSAVRHRDDIYVAGLIPDKYQGVTRSHDLILDLGEAAKDDENILLFLNGWIFPTDASINVAMSQSDEIQSVAPYLQVKDALAQWQTVIENISFPMGKSKTMIVDLSGVFLTEDRHVRIRTNMEIYWDHIFFTNSAVNPESRLTRLTPTAADLHYRGFSRMYRKGGPHGPHWFDYSQATTAPRWIDMAGYYTRFGDVLPLVLADDGKYVIMNAGDEITVEFNASTVPVLPRGWARDYVIYSTGWLKDADINTAAGQTVAPLPFHGMREYPYGPDESYPTDRDHQDYLRKYNTRRVNIKK
ncbi:MAG: VCBS repeat-containing protein [Gemmatimonadota bacterium]|nr:MAG: VCBS repeat-containing protein [Gemmatimonadota bacterium]